jgi:hypothetical protein
MLLVGEAVHVRDPSECRNYNGLNYETVLRYSQALLPYHIDRPFGTAEDGTPIAYILREDNDQFFWSEEQLVRASGPNVSQVLLI